MKKFTTFICFIYLQVFSQTANLENQHIAVSICTDTSSSYFGAITKYIDKDNNNYSIKNQWFTVMAGNVGATNKSIVKQTDSLIQFNISQFGNLPITCILSYKIYNNSIVLNLKSWVSQKNEFPKGFDFIIQSNFTHIYASNHGMKGSKHLIANTDNYPSHLNTSTTIHNGQSSITFYIRNPFHSLWQFNKNSIHKLHIIPVLKPYTHSSLIDQAGPDISSKLNPNDTIYRTIEIYNSLGVQTPICFNEHKDGHSQAITMYWDELPNRDNWAFMTTEDATDVKYDHFWVRLMNEYPKLKMGYVFLNDRILFRYNTSFDSWGVNSTYIISDSLDESEGEWCVNLIAEKQNTLKIHQDITCESSTNYTLSYDIKTMDISGTGAYGEVYGLPNEHLIKKGVSVKNTNNWQNKTIQFKSGSNDNLLRVFLRIENSTGSAFFDNIKLIKGSESTNRIQNPGFEKNHPRILYDNKRRHWSDAHGIIHLPTKATKEYLNFLIRIEKDSLLYGWEDRVRLGSHGYHHTPSLYEPDIPAPGWEFQYYDTKGDQLTIKRIFEDTYKIGLTKKSLRYIRCPGIKYTKSLVDILVDSGFVFMDPSLKKNNFHSCFIQRGKNRLWTVNVHLWADIQAKDTPNKLISNLSLGHLGHIGGHPENVFLDAKKENYQLFSDLITQCETKFPNMGYVFPDEYADNANSIYDLEFVSVTEEGELLKFVFKGAIKKGVSINLAGTCSNALFDGKNIKFKISNNCSYFPLPESPDSIHTLEIKNALIAVDFQWNNTNSYKHLQPAVKIINGKIFLNLKTACGFSFEIYNLQGKKLFSSQPEYYPKPGIKTIIFNSKLVSKGMYVFRFFLNDKIINIKNFSF